MSSNFEIIRNHLATTVPFAAHTGVELISVADGEGEAILDQVDTSINHVGSQHAGALFTLGETASGAAMAGVFASSLFQIRPVAASANIVYEKIAKGTITAQAVAARPSEELRARLDSEGKVAFDIAVTLFDSEQRIVAQMTVNWHISKLRQ